MTESINKRSHTLPLVIIALITLFNPNINLIDIFPDFIGYFLLARAFLRPSFSCPYFEEARRGFIRLFWFSLLKIPAFVAMILVRASNTQDNDVVALLTLVFCIVELILLLPTVKNTFEALIYLAGRQGLSSVLREDGKNCASAVRSLTVIYFIFKCAAYTLPEFLRLTRIMDIGNQTVVATGSRIYPFVIVGVQLIGYAFGAIWLAKSLVFVGSVRKEGKFHSAVAAQEAGLEEGRYRRAVDCGRRKIAHLMPVLAAIASFDLVFSNYRGINLMPSFISGLCIILCICLLFKFLDRRYLRIKLASLISASVFTSAATLSYALSVVFLTKYDYTSIYNGEKGAATLYSIYEASALCELIFYAVMLVFLAIFMRAYVRCGFGIGLRDERYGRLEKEYHRSLSIKAAVFSVIAAIGGIAEYLNIVFNGRPAAYDSYAGDTLNIIIGSSAPWLSAVTVIISAVLTLYSVYLCSILNQELKDEYSK